MPNATLESRAIEIPWYYKWRPFPSPFDLRPDLAAAAMQEYHDRHRRLPRTIADLEALLPFKECLTPWRLRRLPHLPWDWVTFELEADIDALEAHFGFPIPLEDWKSEYAVRRYPILRMPRKLRKNEYYLSRRQRLFHGTPSLHEDQRVVRCPIYWTPDGVVQREEWGTRGPGRLFLNRDAVQLLDLATGFDVPIRLGSDAAIDALHFLADCLKSMPQRMKDLLCTPVTSLEELADAYGGFNPSAWINPYTKSPMREVPMDAPSPGDYALTEEALHLFARLPNGGIGKIRVECWQSERPWVWTGADPVHERSEEQQRLIEGWADHRQVMLAGTVGNHLMHQKRLDLLVNGQIPPQYLPFRDLLREARFRSTRTSEDGLTRLYATLPTGDNPALFHALLLRRHADGEPNIQFDPDRFGRFVQLVSGGPIFEEVLVDVGDETGAVDSDGYLDFARRRIGIAGECPPGLREFPQGIEPDHDPALIQLQYQVGVLFRLVSELEPCLTEESVWETMIRQWGPPNAEFWINAYTGDPMREMPLGEGTPGDYSIGLDDTVPYVVFYYRTIDGGIAMRPVTYRD